MTERVSLTKAQRESAIGAELLSLCQSVTEDGSLSLLETRALVNWLNANRNTDLPAKSYLFETAKRIVADGKVTPDELRELYQAIEVILPSDVRREAVKNRKEFESEIKHRDKIEKDAQIQRKRAVRELNSPVISADFMVAGVHHEGRGDYVSRYVVDNMRVMLVRDPRNPFSRNAIQVQLTNFVQIGFVPEDDARTLSPHMDRGLPQWAHVKKVLWGGMVPIPVIIAYLYRQDARVEGLILPPPVVRR